MQDSHNKSGRFKKAFYILIVFVIMVSITSANVYIQDYNNPLTRSIGDTIYCMINGDCEIDNLIVENLTVQGDVLNVSVINYNVTGVLSADNITTQTLKIKGLTNCDTIDSDSVGLLSCGTDETSNGTVGNPFNQSLNTSDEVKFYNLTVTDLVSCDTVDTDANGLMSCGSDDGGSGGGNSTSWSRSGTDVFLTNDGDKVDINGTLDVTEFITVGTRNKRVTHNSSMIVGVGSTSDYAISIQDGTGRVQHYWNVNPSDQTYLVSGEGVSKMLFYPATSPWFSLQYAGSGTAGNSVTWSDHLEIETDGDVIVPTGSIKVETGNIDIEDGQLTIVADSGVRGLDIEGSGGSVMAFSVSQDQPTSSLDGRAFTVSTEGDSYATAVFYANGFYGIGNRTATRDSFIGRCSKNTMCIGSDFIGNGTGHFIVTGNIMAGTSEAIEKLTVNGSGSFNGSINAYGYTVNGTSVCTSENGFCNNSLTCSSGNPFNQSLNTSDEVKFYNLTVTDLVSCDTIDTDANGLMSCGSDDGGSGGNPFNQWLNTTSYPLFDSLNITNDIYTNKLNSSEVETSSINITLGNMTDVNCIIFNSGGKICSGT